MAKPVCSYCEQFEGIVLCTNLDDGETQVVCGNDVVMWAMSMAAQLSQGMTPEQAEAYGELFDQIRANDVRQPKPPAKGGGRKRKAEVPPSEPAEDATGSSGGGRVDLPEPHGCGSETATGDYEKLTCDGCGDILATADGL